MKPLPRRSLAAGALLAAALAPGAARAQGLPFDPAQFAEPARLIVNEIAREILTTAALIADHRPYQPATPLGTDRGIDIGLDLTLVKVPRGFLEALQKAGLAQGVEIPAIPIPRLQIHKGIGDRLELGFSIIRFMDYAIYGGDVKVAVGSMGEGPLYALRLCYSQGELGFVRTATITPQLLMSKELQFADPYLGVGYQYSAGKLGFTFTQPPILNDPITIESDEFHAGGFLAFMGLALKLPGMGVKMTTEGSYSSLGAHSLGVKLSLHF